MKEAREMVEKSDKLKAIREEEQRELDEWQPPTESWESFWARQDKTDSRNYIMRMNLFETPHMQRELEKIQQKYF